MKSEFDRYFLAANSFEGFVSFFGDSYSAESGYKTYIIKGGPGTGKSTLMKNIALKAIDKGFTVHICHCSSDPDSLDGVIIDETKTVILDGTSPHIVEPKYPGVCENIIDLGAFWNSKSLQKNRIEIINATNINKALHKTASIYLKVCGEIAKDILKTAKTYTKKEKSLEFAKKLAEKHISKKSSKKGTETIRFLSGITPKGIMSFPKTITGAYKNLVVLEDKIGAFSTVVTEYFRKYATDNGYDIIVLKNPFLPNEITDHIIIPELGFAVVTENDYIKFDCNTKRIHSRRFSDTALKKQQRNRQQFSEKVKEKMLFGAVETLSKAKKSHDILEQFYIDSMDYNMLEKYTKEICDKIV